MQLTSDSAQAKMIKTLVELDKGSRKLDDTRNGSTQELPESNDQDGPADPQNKGSEDQVIITSSSA